MVEVWSALYQPVFFDFCDIPDVGLVVRLHYFVENDPVCLSVEHDGTWVGV